MHFVSTKRGNSPSSFKVPLASYASYSYVHFTCSSPTHLIGRANRRLSRRSSTTSPSICPLPSVRNPLIVAWLTLIKGRMQRTPFPCSQCEYEWATSRFPLFLLADALSGVFSLNSRRALAERAQDIQDLGTFGMTIPSITTANIAFDRRRLSFVSPVCAL